MTFISYSQAGQDAFVHALLGDQGTFLDIGASHPTELSNTYGLEQVGWTGVCVEIEHSLCELLRVQRKAVVREGDAIKMPWGHPWRAGDYLSLDIDGATLDVLRKLMEAKYKFLVITIEHDAYRFGDTLRIPEREILTAAGYVLVRPDVCCTPGMPFEDWWVTPELVEKARALP